MLAGHMDHASTGQGLLGLGGDTNIIVRHGLGTREESNVYPCEVF